MLRSKAQWKKIEDFINHVLLTKEKEEREREHVAAAEERVINI